MPVRLRCQCGQSLTLPEQKAGLQVLCPVCKQALTIPAASTSGTSELVAAATSKVQAELVAAIAGEKKAAPTRSEKTKASTKPNQQAQTGPSKERPLPSPAGAPPTSSARPEPRVPTPRAAAKPPPRKSQPKPPAPPASLPVDAKVSPPPRIVAKQTAAPPPLPTAKESNLAPVVAIPLPPPVAPAAPTPAPPVGRVESTTATAIVAKPEKAQEPNRATAKVPPPPADATPPKPASEVESLRGVEHDPAKRLTVYQLGAALAALALAATYPAFAEIVRHVRDPLSPGIENWAYMLLVLCGVQLSYAIYLVQLPDWSSVWVTMIVTAIVAALYAIGMGMSLMARPDNELIATLGLTQLHAGGYLSLWCFLLTMLTALLSYALVRTSVRWHKMFELAMSHADA